MPAATPAHPQSFWINHSAPAAHAETRIERERIPLTLCALATGEVFSDVLFAVRFGSRMASRCGALWCSTHDD